MKNGLSHYLSQLLVVLDLITPTMVIILNSVKKLLLEQHCCSSNSLDLTLNKIV